MIRKSLSILILSTVSVSSFAVTPEMHHVPLTCKAETITNFNSNSNLAQTIQTWSQEITTNTNQTLQGLQINSQAIIDSISSSSVQISADYSKSLQNNSNREREMALEISDMNKDYDLELIEQQRRVGLGISENETKEEIDFILSFLDIATEKNLSIREAEALIESTYDESNAITIGVATHSGKINCSEEQREQGLCTIPKKIDPAKTMMTYFEQCNQTKIAQVKVEREANSRRAAIKNESEKTASAVQNKNSRGNMLERAQSTKEINCTPELKISGYCGSDISEEDFQEKMVKNEIITNGNISPTNALTPSDFGGLEYGIELDAQDVQILKEEAFDYSDFDKYENQNPEQVPIIYTYRNSSQLKAALSYVDTMVNDNLVENQEERFRNLPRSSEFQARYNSRIASLNLVRNSFTDSVKSRTGQKLGEIWSGQSETKLDDLDENNVVKESYLGAGELDILINSINSAYQEVSLSGGTNPADQQNKIEDANEKYWMMKNYEMVNLQNQVLLRQLMQNERAELIKAAQLQNMVNDPENIDYLNKIRNQ